MLRDNLQDKSYFDEAVEFYEESIVEDIEELKSGKLTKVVSMRFCFGLIIHAMNLLNNKYSRGDKLGGIKPLLQDVLTYRKWQNDYANALPEQEQAERISWEEMREDYLEQNLKWLSFAYCLDMGEEYYLKALEFIGNQGQDALFDKISVKLGDSGRDIASDILFKKRFSKLYKVIEGSPEQRPSLANDYIESWYNLIGRPDYHLMDNDAYDGYWCWEIALVVKLFNIDDSSFIDHPYYPKDLVHWQDNQ